MKCSEFLQLLDDELDQKMAAEVRAAIESHTLKCEHCEVVFNTTLKTIEIYKSNEVYELPAGLRERLHAAIMVKCKSCK
jgi:predicted anti-sigma-YlaC factor YlaD